MDETTTLNDSSLTWSEQIVFPDFPVLLVVSSPEGTVGTDCCKVTSSFTVGRSNHCQLTIRDQKISRQHFRIQKKSAGFEIRDLDSKNHTYLQGSRIEGTKSLTDKAVIRVGRTLLVFHERGGVLIDPPPTERFDMAGRFHVEATIQRLREASLSSRHCLITGHSGTGKELAAKALAAMMAKGSRADTRIIAHNAARFASEEEAATTLFGVGSRVFSGVDARAGLIEEAKEGVLFLDEAHCLPDRIQKSLLRVIEENKTARIGEVGERSAEVRFVLASNLPPPDYGLARDLIARLRVVPILPLSERIADIPTIFQYLLDKALMRLSIKVDADQPRLHVHHCEKLLLDGFENDNVRGLVDLSDKIATRVAAGFTIDDAISTAFVDRFGRKAPRLVAISSEEPNASHYERYKRQIIASYETHNYNLSATERHLRDENIQCSRRWIRHYLKEWGVYRNRYSST